MFYPSISWPLLLSIYFLLPPYLASGPTKIYINQVPEYSLLSSCAEAEVRTIVRDMSSGCGDGGQRTSYGCFCFQSSAIFSSIISRDVRSSCAQDPGQATSALEVFSSYCELGFEELNATGSSTISSAAAITAPSSLFSTARPASTPFPSTARATATSNSSEGSKNSSSRTVAIAAGVSVPVGVIALGLLALVFLRQRRHVQEKEGPPVEVDAEPHTGLTEMVGWPEASDRKQSTPQELEATMAPVELESRKEKGQKEG